MDFIPNEVYCNVGNTIQFNMSNSHNAVEKLVSQIMKIIKPIRRRFQYKIWPHRSFVPNEAKHTIMFVNRTFLME